MTTGIGQAYTRIGAQRTSEMLGMTFCNGVVPAITGGKLRHVLEAVLDEIDFQMVEESVERIPGICNRRWLLAVPDQEAQPQSKPLCSVASQACVIVICLHSDGKTFKRLMTD